MDPFKDKACWTSQLCIPKTLLMIPIPLLSDGVKGDLELGSAWIGRNPWGYAAGDAQSCLLSSSVIQVPWCRSQSTPQKTFQRGLIPLLLWLPIILHSFWFKFGRNTNSLQGNKVFISFSYLCMNEESERIQNRKAICGNSCIWAILKVCLEIVYNKKKHYVYFRIVFAPK